LPKDKSLLNIPDSGCGINSNGNYLISLSLSGQINFWNISTLEDGKLPDKVINGHQNYISSIVNLNTKLQIVSSDVSGKVVLWNSQENQFTAVINTFENKVVGLAASPDQNILYALIFDGTVAGIDLNNYEILYYIFYNI
jgi:WD40 repeat protein